MEGSVAQGLSAARYGENTFADECAAQSNFHDDTALHIDEMPTVTVVDVESGEVHGVVGERGGTRPLQKGRIFPRGSPPFMTELRRVRNELRLLQFSASSYSVLCAFFLLA